MLTMQEASILARHWIGSILPIAAVNTFKTSSRISGTPTERAAIPSLQFAMLWRARGAGASIGT